MCHWINILYLVYILIIANCHCSMSVCFHCRASRAFAHICIESFQGPCPGPLNKTIYTITCAFVSIHQCWPSAQAIPTLGVVIPWKKTGTQYGAYGWWLPSQRLINIRQQHVSWPVADLKVVWKLSPFHKTTAVNVWLFSSGRQADLGRAWCHHTAQIHWQANFGSMLHHHTVQYRWDHVVECSAHIPMGDIRSGIEDQDQFLQKSNNSDNEGTTTFLPKTSGHPQSGGATDHAGSRDVLALHSGQLLCQGHMTLTGCWEHQTLCKVQKSLNFLKSAWGTLVLMCHVSKSLDPVRSDHFSFFTISLHHSPTPDWSPGIIILSRFMYK